MKNPVGRPATNNVFEGGVVLLGEPNYTMHLAMKKSRMLALHAIAASHGCFHGNRTSLSRLLREIADGRLAVVPTDRLVQVNGVHVINQVQEQDPDQDPAIRPPMGPLEEKPFLPEPPE